MMYDNEVRMVKALEELRRSLDFIMCFIVVGCLFGCIAAIKYIWLACATQ